MSRRGRSRRGWADLERAEILDTGHLLPASGLAALVTVTAVLRLVAEGRFALDRPANDHLRTVRLADDTITVRELLSHSSGIDNIAGEPGRAVRRQRAGAGGGHRAGRRLRRPARRGSADQLRVRGARAADRRRHRIAVRRRGDAAGAPAAGDEPVSVSGPAADIGPGAVTGYTVTAAGAFEPVPATVCTLQAAGGLWATAADLVRLGTGWSSLLPAALAREALAPQAASTSGEGHAGLGWLIRPRGDTAFLGGRGPDGIASLTIRLRDNRTHLVMASRLVLLDSVDDRHAAVVDEPVASFRNEGSLMTPRRSSRRSPPCAPGLRCLLPGQPGAAPGKQPAQVGNGRSSSASRSRWAGSPTWSSAGRASRLSRRSFLAGHGLRSTGASWSAPGAAGAGAASRRARPGHDRGGRADQAVRPGHRGGRPELHGPSRAGDRLPRPERRREDHHDADHPGPGRPDLGHGRSSAAAVPGDHPPAAPGRRAAGRRRGAPGANRLRPCAVGRAEQRHRAAPGRRGAPADRAGERRRQARQGVLARHEAAARHRRSRCSAIPRC